MKRRILIIVLCLAFAFVLAGCEFINSLLLPAVTLEDAKEAMTATSLMLFTAFLSCSVENGSTSSVTKHKNADGTLFYEAPTATSYPATSTITAKDFVETNSGYTFNGTFTETYTSLKGGIEVFDLDLDHASKVVKKITGTVNFSGSTGTGTLKFNHDEYPVSDLISTT